MDLDEIYIGIFRTGETGIFKSGVFMTSRKSGNGRVWHIAGMRFETLDEVRKIDIPEEYLLELVLEFGVPKKHI